MSRWATDPHAALAPTLASQGLENPPLERQHRAEERLPWDGLSISLPWPPIAGRAANRNRIMKVEEARCFLGLPDVVPPAGYHGETLAAHAERHRRGRPRGAAEGVDADGARSDAARRSPSRSMPSGDSYRETEADTAMAEAPPNTCERLSSHVLRCHLPATAMDECGLAITLPFDLCKRWLACRSSRNPGFH